jgi:hypothetical protein
MVRSRVGGRMIEALSLRHCHRHDHGLPYAYCRSPTARKARHNGPETPRHRAGIIRNIQEATGFGHPSLPVPRDPIVLGP